jgi:diacylglycerol kinase family enzyme
VDGRIFVNNVSLGHYAALVQSPDYRDATTAPPRAALPQMLGPDTKPFDLRFETADGTAYEGAHVIQISNSPYGTTVRGMTSRPRLDTGLLGIFALEIPDSVSATRYLTAAATGHPEAYPGYVSWNAPAFTVDSGGPIAVGLDGESLSVDPPLVFSSRPGVLRVRLPKHAIGFSPAARSVSLSRLPVDLCRVAIGRPIRIGV